MLVVTEVGGTARLVAKYRPRVPVLATTNSIKTARQLTISYGILPYYNEIPTSELSHSLVQDAIEYGRQIGIIKRGDSIVITSGQVEGFAEGTTTIMRVQKVN